MSAVRKVDYAKNDIFNGLTPLHLDNFAPTHENGKYCLYSFNGLPIFFIPQQ